MNLRNSDDSEYLDEFKYIRKFGGIRYISWQLTEFRTNGKSLKAFEAIPKNEKDYIEFDGRKRIQINETFKMTNVILIHIQNSTITLNNEFKLQSSATAKFRKSIMEMIYN